MQCLFGVKVTASQNSKGTLDGRLSVTYANKST